MHTHIEMSKIKLICMNRFCRLPTFKLRLYSPIKFSDNHGGIHQPLSNWSNIKRCLRGFTNSKKVTLLICLAICLHKLHWSVMILMTKFIRFFCSSIAISNTKLVTKIYRWYWIYGACDCFRRVRFQAISYCYPKLENISEYIRLQSIRMNERFRVM